MQSNTATPFGDHEPQVLPNVKDFLTKYNHFYSTKSASETSTCILDIIKQQGADFVIEVEKYRILCDAYPDGKHIKYRIHFYKESKDSDQIIVEMLRTSGDQTEFCNRYNETLKASHECGIVKYIEPEKVGFGGLKHAPGMLPQHERMRMPKPILDLNKEGTDKSIKHMTSMLESPYCDMKLTMAESVASLLHEPANREVIAKSELGQELVRNLLCESADVRRACATCVAFLCDTEEGAKAIRSYEFEHKTSSGAETVHVTVIEALRAIIEANCCKQSVREARRALDNMSRFV